MSDKRLLNKKWRISNLYKIKDKHKKMIKFNPNKAQQHFENNKHTRNIILKSRQLGFSTYEAIDMLDDTLFIRNFEGLFIAQDLETARDIYDKKIRLAWDNFKLKDFYIPDYNSARKLKVDFGDKTFSGITVDSSGRSGTYNRLHITEFGKLCKTFPEKAQEVIDGSIPAIPNDGRVDIESTAESSDDLFYDLFWKAFDNPPKYKTQFKAHFYNWQWDDEIKNTEVINDLPIEFREYQKQYSLSDKEISYYYLKFLALGESERTWSIMKREYPTTPEEAFEGAGNKLFDLQKLGLQKKTNPIQEYSGFRVYKDYQLGHLYGMGVDTSEGIGKDSNTMALWDFTPTKPEIVADYENANIAPDLLAFEIKNLAEKYNYPLVVIERNNTGHTTISKLRDIYSERHIFKDEDDKFGWRATLVSKPKVVFDLVRATDEELVGVNSARIISEMRRVDREMLRSVQPKDEITRHWDLLTAACIGFQLRNNPNLIKRNVLRKQDIISVKRGSGIYGI